MSRFTEGRDAAQAIAKAYGIQLHELRRFAAQHLQDEGWPEGEGVGSSDVSIHLSELALTQPGLLREEAWVIARRNELIARVSEGTGRSEAETLDRLRRLLAPSLPGVCLWQAHAGTIGPRNHAEPEGPTAWEGVCGQATTNESGMCDEHERDRRANYPNAPLPRLTEIPDWLVDQPRSDDHD